MIPLLFTLAFYLQSARAQGACPGLGGNCTLPTPSFPTIPGCNASCFVSVPTVKLWYWTSNTEPPVHTTEAVAATVVYYVDPANPTLTTASSTVDNSLSGYTPGSTQEAPKPTSTIISYEQGDATITTTLTYPTAFTAPYDPTYEWEGTLATRTRCITADDLVSVPLPSSYSFPVSTNYPDPSDTLGTGWMPTFTFETPAAFTWASLYPGEAAFQLCSPLTVLSSPSTATLATTSAATQTPKPEQKTSVKFLIETSVVKGPAPPDAQFANAATQQGAGPSPNPQPAPSPNSQPAPSPNSQPAPSPNPQPAPSPNAQPPSNPFPAPAAGSTPAVVYSGQTIAVGKTATIGGATVVATTAAGGLTQLIVGGSSTVAVSPPAQYTGAAAVVGQNGFEYVLGIAVGVVGVLL